MANSTDIARPVVPTLKVGAAEPHQSRTYGRRSGRVLGWVQHLQRSQLAAILGSQSQLSASPTAAAALVSICSRPGDGGAYLEAFFRRGLTETNRKEYSHAIRWANTAPLRRFFSARVKEALKGYDPTEEIISRLRAHPAFNTWAPLSQAQYIEASIFLSEYLLSSQGDRMLAAHSVEGRFPFLDQRLIEFSSRIPPQLKIRGLNEKFILKQAVQDILPQSVCARTKRPYRAPVQHSFFGERAPQYVRDLLSPDAIRSAGYFHPPAVTRLVLKAQRTHLLSERDNMALAGILSTQLLHQQFIEAFPGQDIPPGPPPKLLGNSDSLNSSQD